MSVNSKMTAIADAIRNLLDISGPMGLDAMANNISSITKRGAVAGTILTKAEQYIIPDGYHNGNGSVGIADAEQAKIIAENIKSGVTILGVAGSASGEIFSIIAVTYPFGSTCTCSDGTTTLTARDTSGKALFNVTVGEWTVTAKTTDGSKEKSVDVTITAAGQVENVTLTYELVLYDHGDLCVDVTGGWEKVGYKPSSIIFNDDHIYWTYGEGANVDSSVVTKNLIDFSGYTKLRFEVAYSGITYWCRCGYGADQSYSSFTAYVQLSGTNESNITKDVSLENVGQVYPKVFFGASVTYLKIYRIWLE